MGPRHRGYGRGLDLEKVRSIIDFAVGQTRPDITLLLHVPLAVSEARRQSRQAGQAMQRDRFEDADRGFFERVEEGYRAIAAAEPGRVKWIDATQHREEVSATLWELVRPLVLSGKLAEPDR